LTTIIGALLTDPHIEIYKMEKCDAGGWHIFFETRKDYSPKEDETTCPKCGCYIGECGGWACNCDYPEDEEPKGKKK
jgi:hypothetical protein